MAFRKSIPNDEEQLSHTLGFPNESDKQIFVRVLFGVPIFLSEIVDQVAECDELVLLNE